MNLILGILLSSLSIAMHTSQTFDAEELSNIPVADQHFIKIEDEGFLDNSPSCADNEHDTKNNNNDEFIEQFYTVALRSAQARKEEHTYYHKLYTRFIKDSLAAQKQPHSRPPYALLSSASVHDSESYALQFYSHNDALFHNLTRIRITIDHRNKDQPYTVLVPLLDTERRDDMRVTAPCSYQEALGEISCAIADMTSFTSENRKLHNRKANRNIWLLTASSLTAMTTYFAYYAHNHPMSLSSMMYSSSAIMGGHMALFLSLQYRRLCALDKRIKKDHLDIENKLVSSTKPIAALEPIIITLARSYAQYKIKKHVAYLSRRKCRGWLCCRPLLGAIYDYFKRPSDIEETIPQRISSLLEKFHGKLSANLETETKMNGNLSRADQAQFIIYSYQSVLLSLNELQPERLSHIIEQSGLSEESFTPKQLTSLKKTIKATQQTLEQCMPKTITQAIHTITPPLYSQELAEELIDDLEEIR